MYVSLLVMSVSVTLTHFVCVTFSDVCRAYVSLFVMLVCVTLVMSVCVTLVMHVCVTFSDAYMCHF